MTEDEFHSLPYFDNLPVFSSMNRRSREITSVRFLDTSYADIVECNEYEDALRALKKDIFVPRGTVRYQTEIRHEPEFLVNYVVFFWMLRKDLQT